MKLEEKERGKLPITLRDDVQGFAKRFTSGRQIAEFLLEERNFHVALGEAARRSPARSVAAVLPGAPVNEHGESSGLPVDVYINELRNYVQVSPPISTGRYGPLLKQISEVDPDNLDIAYRIIARRVQTAAKLPPSDSRVGYSETEIRRYGFVLEMAEALRSDRQLAKATQLAAVAVAEDAKEISAVARDMTITRDNVVREIREIMAKIEHSRERAFVTFKAESDEAITSAALALDEHRDSSLKAIDALRDQLEAHMVTEAPTKYWKDKAFTHGVYAGVAGVVFVVILGVAMWLFMSFGLEYVAVATARIIEAGPESGVVALVPLLFVTVPSLAVAWILRHVSRVIIQNLSLQADAKLRGTIAHTYLALTAKDKPSEAQLAIALQALFRPMDGSSHAEVAPPSLSDIIKIMPGGK